MDSTYAVILCVAGFLLIGAPSSFLLWFWLVRKGWATLRLLAASLFVMNLAVGAVLWFLMRKSGPVLLMVLLAVWSVVSVLTLSRTSSGLMRRLRLRW